VERDVIREQITYYSARAPEYHNVILSSGPLAVARRHLLALGPLRDVLELAPGTGNWTEELVRIGETVTVVDASPEMMEINRQRIADARVEYRQADLFQWTADRQYDLVFSAFFLSHVPPDLVDAFLVRTCSAVRPEGHLFIVDQCDDLPNYPVPAREGIYEQRALLDGRTFSIVKVYYHPAVLAERVRTVGFQATAERIHPFFCLRGTRIAP